MISSLFVVLVGFEPTMFTAWVSDFKSVASSNWATGAYKIKKPELLFRGSGLYLIWSYLLHHEINPNFAQPEPAVLIHNVFTTIVRFKLIFRFIVFIISYILKSLCPFWFCFTNIRRFFQSPNLFYYFSVFIVLQIYNKVFKCKKFKFQLS